jgi:WD40 repeat protein
MLAASAEDGTLTLWDTASWKEKKVIQAHKGPVTAMAVSADGQVIASGGEDRLLKFWSVETGKQCADPQEMKGQLWCVAFSPDGKRIAWSAGDPFAPCEVRLGPVSAVLGK